MPRNSPDQPPEQGPGWSWRAAESGLPVFPIRILWDPVARKWQKTPLTRRGHLDATTDVSVFGDLWRRADGYGARMGGGFYGLDLDLAKDGCKAESWFDRWQVPRETRTIRTITGGLHRIYRVLPEQGELPGRQNVVFGLDGRGGSGWLAFGAALGEAYTLIDDSEPALLPEGACKDIRDGYTGTGGKVELGPLEPVDGDAVMMKLALAMGRNRTLRRRWAGQRPPRADGWTIDTTLSAMDHSMAKLLAIGGITEAEIVHLLTRFEHGVVRRDGLNAKTVRAIRRSAAVVTKQIRDEQAALAAAFNIKTEYSPEDIAEMEAALFGPRS